MIEIKNSNLNDIYNPQEIESILSKFTPYQYETQELRNSAVLIPIFPVNWRISGNSSFFLR